MADSISTRLGGADSMLIPDLPDDLSVQCIARVPRSCHPALEIVSRSWRSLLRSRRLFALRADLGATEPSFCVNICNQSRESKWYFLNLRPCRLLSLPPNPFPTVAAGCAVLGSSLYVLGGYGQSNIAVPSSAVQIFDPCLNRWITGPPMAEARGFPLVNAFNGRIYVFGGCGPPSGDSESDDDYEPESDAWAEVFDPATGAWASLPRRPAHLRNRSGNRSAVFGGKIVFHRGMVFDPEAAQPWGTMPEVLRSEWAGHMVVLDGVPYSRSLSGKLAGYDPVVGVWKPVEGVERELPHYMLRSAKLTTLRGLLCFVWVLTTRNVEPGMRGMPFLWPDMNYQTEIHCVGVQITRTSCGGFRGSIAWPEVVALPIPGYDVRDSVVLDF